MSTKVRFFQERLLSVIKQPFFRFLIFFFGFLLLLQWITHWIFIREPFTYLTSWAVSNVIQWFVPSATLQTVNGSFHILAGIDMEIIYECTGVYGVIVLLAGIWATRFPWMEKYIFSVLGTLFIILINLIRLVTLFLLAQYNPKWFPFLHTYFWQLFLIWFVVMAFYLWIQSMQKKHPNLFP